jgi:hypothetical protein
MDSMLAGTVGTAEKLSIPDLHAMPDDDTPAVGAPGRQGMDRAFETVKNVSLIPLHHFKGLVIFISADFTFCHFSSFRIHQLIGGRPWPSQVD